MATEWGPVRFGLFDWLDESGRGLGPTYEERLRLLEFADEAGFYCYHLAEHHNTELSTVPSPNLFLSAVAQRTRRLRLGPLGYVLPTYNPLRLLEEIAMLDQMSGGRLEVGIGRGSSAHEVAYFGVAADEMRPRFQEALDVIIQGLSTGELDYQGRHFQYDHVVTRLRPVQQPYPPLWYPTSNTASIPWIAGQGLSTIFAVHLAPTFDRVVEMLQAYRQAWEAHRHDPGRLNGHVAWPHHGFTMHVHVAATDEQAIDQARESYAKFIYNFTHRYVIRGEGAKYAGRDNFDRELAEGRLLVGSPATVRDQLGDYLARSGANYFLGSFMFGSFPPEQARTSLDLFAREVMPAVAQVTT